MTRPTLIGILLVVMISSVVWAGEKPSDIAKKIAKPFLDKELSLNEVVKFTEQRVVPMPEVSSVEEWEKHANRMRKDVLEKVVLRGEAAKWKDAPLKIVRSGKIDGGEGYHIEKLRYEAVPGLWIPALLYVPENLGNRKVSVILNVNGHDGKGKVAPYKQIRCINLAKRGMLALNVEWLGMGQLKGDGFVHYRMNQLDLCGTSGLAPFYLSMSRGIDLLLDHKNADPSRVAVAGLSGGGWQTIIISALDGRVTLSDPVAGYSSFRTRLHNFSDLGDSEQTPVDLGITADYVQLTAMRAPRPTLLTYNIGDNCCFASGHALSPLLEAARPIYKLYGKQDYLASHINLDPGTHNFEKDNRQAFYLMIGVHFFDGKKFDPTEIPCDDEVKTHEQLLIELPEDNGNFHTLAVDLAKGLPRNAEIPTESKTLDTWREDRRAALAKLVHAHDYQVTKMELHSSEEVDGGTVRRWILSLGESWTLPIVQLEPSKGSGKSEVHILEDSNVTASQVVAVAKKLTDGGPVVYLVSPFYFAHSKISTRDYLFALMISTVGERPVGIQASQVKAVCDWVAKNSKTTVSLHGVGLRQSLIASVAAALGSKSINRLVLEGKNHSLHDVISRNLTVRDAPELFCFGLLEKFDFPQLHALASPHTKVEFLESKSDQ